MSDESFMVNWAKMQEKYSFMHQDLCYFKNLANEPCPCNFAITRKTHLVASGSGRTRREAAANANATLAQLPSREGPYFIKITKL